MKITASTYFMLFFSLSIFSQTNFYTKDWGVTNADLKETKYTPDSTANALIIYEMGESYIDKSTFKLTTKIKKKIKIFNRNAFDQATIEIPLYFDGPQEEIVIDITAVTHNLENGQIIKTKLERSNIFKEAYNSRYNITKFTFPNLQEGSVITYSYTKISPFIFNYHPWDFQSEIPTLYSEYNTSIPANYEYNIKLVGSLPLDYTDQKLEGSCIDAGNGTYADCTVSVYRMKNIPAFIEEEFMTTKENYLSRIDYELKTFRSFTGKVDNVTKSWKSADTEIESQTDLGRQLKRSSMVKKILPENITLIADQLEKAKQIFYFVQENYTFNNKYNLFNDISLKSVLDERSGTISEINILLHNLLVENSIAASPVLLSTRSNGFATKLYPVISEFNYLLIRISVNGEIYLLDASDKYLTFGEIPFNTLNKYGRLLDFKGESSWIDISPKYPSATQQRVEISIDETNKFTGTFKTRTSGYHSLEKRKAFTENPLLYIEDQKRDYSNPTITDHQVIEADKKNPMFVENYDIVYTPEALGDKIIIDPFMYKNFNSNPFKLQVRTYPIDFGYVDSYLYSAKILFGPNYQIENMPEDKNLALPNNTGSLVFSAKNTDEGIEVFLKFEFKRDLYTPEYYPFIKKFISNIIDVQNNTLIVLKKK